MRGTPPHARSLAEALERCSRRGRGALQEGGAALAAAVDALSFVLFGHSAEGSALEPFWLLAVEIGESLGPRRDADGLAREFLEALDREIERWEVRAEDDPTARLVALAFTELRALLGVVDGFSSFGERRRAGPSTRESRAERSRNPRSGTRGRVDRRPTARSSG